MPEVRVRRAVRRAAALVVVGIAGGCGATATPIPSGIEYASYTPSGSGGDSAALEGVLTTSGTCLVVEQAAKAGLVLPLWPDAKVTGRIGKSVELGGGYVENPSEASVPEACARLGLPMFLVNR